MMKKNYVFSTKKCVVRNDIFRNSPNWPWSPPSLLYNAYRVLPGGKAAGALRWSLTPI
jgi:hypothetical protein